MQYADVAVDVPTKTRQDVFTYRIPPAILPYIALGQRTLVPFGGRKLVGTIVDLRATPPKVKHGLKDIIKLVEPFPLFTKQDLDLARAVAKKYGATIGQVLMIASPKVAARIASKIEQKPNNVSSVLREGHVYGLYDRRLVRYTQYVKLISQAKRKKQTALIIVSNQELAAELSAFFAMHAIESEILPPTQSGTPYYTAWTKASLGGSSVVIGTRKAVFLPLQNLGLLIVDEPSAYGYKEEQFPYYSAVTVAKLRAKTHGCHVVLADTLPRVTEWYEQGIGKLQHIGKPFPKQARTILIDTSSSRGFFNESLLQHMRNALRENKTIGLYFNRKGDGRFYRCRDCETAIYCPRCDTLLSVATIDSKSMLTCSNCAYETVPPYRCESCQSYRLGSVGLGIESFKKIVHEHFPNERIGIVGSDTQEKYTISLFTNQIFYLPSSFSYDVLATFHLDTVLHGASWTTSEDALLLLSHLSERTGTLILQTSEPENSVIQSFIGNALPEFYASELQKRKDSHYPPAYPIVRLTRADTEKEKLKNEADSLRELLTKNLPENTEIIGPSPIGSGKKRDKYQYQIIVKSALTNILLKSVTTAWQIDPEPENLSQ